MLQQQPIVARLLLRERLNKYFGESGEIRVASSVSLL